MKTTQKQKRKNCKTMKQKGGVIESRKSRKTIARSSILPSNVFGIKIPKDSIQSKPINTSICQGLDDSIEPQPIQDIINRTNMNEIITEGQVIIGGFKKIVRKSAIFIKSPEHFGLEERGTYDYGTFLYFFKQMIMQPYVRKYFVNKYNPGVYYAFIKFSYGEVHDIINCNKLQFVKEIIHSGEDCILDFSEQLEHGGHYTSLKRNGDTIEYMDPDPFYFGDPKDKSFSNKFHNLLKTFPNPPSIFGDENKANTKIGALRSIQNVSWFDKFCQSWSLFFITLDSYSRDFESLHSRLQFQTKKVIGHDPEQDIKKQQANYPKFIENFKVLLGIWKTLFNDGEIDILLSGNKPGYSVDYPQFKYWTSSNIIQKLDEIEEYINNNNLDYETCKENIIDPYVFESRKEYYIV